MRSLTGWIAVAATAVVVGAMSAAPAAADDPVKPLQLALGDSWAFGSPGTEGGYVAQLHEALQDDFKCLDGPDEGLRPGACPQLELENFAIPGATTKEPDPDGTLIADELPQARALLGERNFNDNPRDNVELITLHTGGNDVTNPILGACVFGIGDCQQTIVFELGEYRKDLTEALSLLREAAGNEATIVIGTYDNTYRSQSPETCSLAGNPLAIALGNLVLEGDPGDQGFQGLHDIMRAVAADHGVEVAEVFGDLNKQKDWADCLHPTETGYEKVSEAFLEALGAP